ncbi:hypothetical protein ACXZ9C_10975 [Streptococcus agalactiae]
MAWRRRRGVVVASRRVAGRSSSRRRGGVSCRGVASVRWSSFRGVGVASVASA